MTAVDEVSASHRSLRTYLLASVAAMLLWLPPLRAEAAASGITSQLQPAYLAKRFDDLGLLYSDKSDPILQELWFLGRYHGQYHVSDGPGGDDDSYENRRFRIGTQMRLFQRLTLHAQMVSEEDLQEFYGGFTELWIQWSFHEALNLTVGQQKHRFSHDRNVSSRYLNYLERAMLTNQFALDYTPAVTLSGRVRRWSYYGGVFSNATSKHMDRSFTDLNSGWSLLAIATYDLQDAFGTDGAFFNLGYVHSDANDRATNLSRFDDGIATALILTEGPASLVTEFLGGFGGERGDAGGVNLQPGIFLTDEFQLVGRYQLAASHHGDGLQAQRRYEREVGLARGDVYQAAYFGGNYYLVGHRLKLMSGVEYSRLDDGDCWTASVAVRLFWGPHSRGPFPMAQMLEGVW